MNFEGSFRYIGSVDPDPILHALKALGPSAWDDYVRRQELFEIHRKTHTIPLLFDEDGRHENPTAWPRLSLMQAALEPAMEMIRAAHSQGSEPGYFVRVLLTRLSPQGAIPPHRDYGFSLLRSHRHHLAVVTNELVEFEIDGEPRHMAAGEIWEINNRRSHAVRNGGAEPRIHVILDYVVPGEQVDDPDGGRLVA